MFKIGRVEIPNRIIAAPMAGISDQAFREIAWSFGCGLVHTEMISAKGLVFGQEKSRQMINAHNARGWLSVQIFGSDPGVMAQAALILRELGVKMIDINMGCPTPKIVRNGEGTALMLNLPLCRSIIRAVTAAVDLPVTIKMRRGWDDDSRTCLELGAIAQEEGARAVTLHPRSRRQFYSGRSDWTLIKEMKDRLSIPVIGNGDIRTAEDALRMLEETGCDAVMIARGALGNPFLFRECISIIERGVKLPEPELGERLAIAGRHLARVCELKGEHTGVREMRKHIAWYIKGLPGAARMREKINSAVTVDEVQELLMNIEEAGHFFTHS